MSQGRKDRKGVTGRGHVEPALPLLCRLLKCASLRTLLMESYEKRLPSPWKPRCKELAESSGFGPGEYCEVQLFWLCMHGLAVTTTGPSGLLIPLLLSLLEDSESKSDTTREEAPPDLLA